jgi:hypothetical protein
MNAIRTLTLCCLVPAALWVSACSVSKETKDLVARTETAVMQAQQTLGNNEAAAIDLQRAKDGLAQAQKAVKGGDDKPAQRYAQQAALDAELALSKAQTATARKASEEIQASIKALRAEAQRSMPATTVR